MLLHPQLPKCEDCKAWMYDLKTGKRVERGGRPCERPKGTKPPCGQCPKIPKGVEPRPENAGDLSDRNRRCYWHYKECRAVGAWPDDGLVRFHAAVIRDVEDAVAAGREDALTAVLVALPQAIGGNKTRG